MNDGIAAAEAGHSGGTDAYRQLVARDDGETANAALGRANGGCARQIPDGRASRMKEFGFRAWLLRGPIPARTRGRLLALYGASVGSNVRVHPITVINPDWINLSIADDAYIGAETILDLSGGLTIKRGAVIAAGVAVMTHQDAGSSHGSPTAQELGSFVRRITIGEYAFVGTRAVILADVGDRCVVGAGAVVHRPVPPGLRVYGIPAKPAS